MFQLYKKQITAKESAQAASQASTELKDAQPTANIATREQNTQKNTVLQSENKVVECSILTPRDTPETATKETQSTLHAEKSAQRDTEEKH
jgi:hypothetical protein